MDHGFLSFAKNIGKNLSHKYSQKLLDRAKKSTANVVKTYSKRAIQKTAEATGDLIDNKTTDEIIKIFRKYFAYRWEWNRNTKRKDIYLQEKDSKLLMN